jgi:uncharacterized protein (TIGR02246 family)
MNATQFSDVHVGVERAMASFERAQRAIDAEALLSHFSSRAFYMHNDGQRLSRDTICAGVAHTFRTLKAIEGRFSGLQIHVLSPDAALATALFSETITAHDGTVVRQRGAATWLWQLEDGAWKITYGHVDHYGQ